MNSAKRNLTLLVLSLLALAGLALVLVIQFSTRYKIVGYHQSDSSITIRLNGNVVFGKLLKMHNVPEHFDAPILKRQAEFFIPFGSSISIPLEGEPADGEYSIFIFLGNDYFELVRQSERWLDQTFDFTRPGGYTILGRRSIDTESGSVAETKPLTVLGRPESISTIKYVNQFHYDEINIAASLLESLWAQPIRQGPVAGSYAEFVKQPFIEKLRRVRVGEFSLMCTGFRDLFIHASFSVPGLKVRAVEAVNYYPSHYTQLQHLCVTC